MKNKNIRIAGLVLALAFLGQQARAQFVKMDDFTNSTFGNLVGQFSDGPSRAKWLAAGNGGTGGIVITNSPTPGAGQPGSGTPVSATTNAAVTTTVDAAASLAFPTPILTSSTVATIFMQFDMGSNTGSNNVNWAVVNTPGSDAGGGNDMVELNANAPSRYGLTIRNGGSFVEMSADGVNEFVPQTNTIYDMWFVIDNAAKNFSVYMQDASPSGPDLPNLTKMHIATTGAGNAPASYTFVTNAIGFRNTTAATLSYFVFGNGGGGVPPQYLYSVYEDPNSLDLTNPVTGAAPVTLGPPVITSQPQAVQLYPGATAVFTVAATGGGLNYQWKTNGVSLANGGKFSGATSGTLTVGNVSAANAVNYSCVVNNANTGAYQSTNSAAASLTLVTPNGAFETAVAAAAPLHFYAFDDTGDPSTGGEVAFDYAGSDNGVYGANSQNGFDSVAGPRPVPDGFPGFSAANYAVQFNSYAEPSHVTVVAPWNLNTNTVTITAWINPNSPQDNLTALVLNRGGGSDVEGLIFNNSGNSTLGYNWNNDPETTSWDSGLQPPANQWSFVTLVVTPTNATISMMNTNGLVSSTHVYAHAPAAFGGTTMIGDDSGTTTGALTFGGLIDEVAVFGAALTESQLQGIFTNASGVAAYPPGNAVTLVTPSPIYPGQAAQFSSTDGGSLPLYYQWQLNGVNLTDGAGSAGKISGSATPFLTISNLAVADAGQNYNLTLVTSNSSGSYTSSVPAVLSVSVPSAAQIIYTLGFEASGSDWNTGSSWSDGNAASNSVYSEPGSIYQVVPGTLERSPVSTNASFPGSPLVIEGDGVLIDGNAATFPANTTTGELRLKQSGGTSVTNFGTVYTDGGSVYFPDLQLNGGQIDNGTSSKVTLDGEMDVLTNSAIYADSAANGSIRAIQINSFMTGAGTISYAYLSSANFTNNDLVISGTTNTFSGQWNVIQGTLLGNATNSLGTNTIMVGTNGTLETTYNIRNPKGDLYLNGEMYLYTSNVFSAVSINGVNLAVGTYTFAQLNRTYPANFPATWPVQVGSVTGTNTRTGSITVLTTLLPQIIQQPAPASLTLYPGQTAQFTALVSGATSYQWWFTNLDNVGIMLADGGNVSGSHTNVLTVTSVTDNSAGTYTLVAGNPVGTVTSSSATLAIGTPGPATSITMSVVEEPGQDWDSATNWSDGNPASVSAYSEPGSTYTVLPGAALCTPDISANTAFPGDLLVIANGGELVLEHAGSRSITFPNLQLDGGLLDNGADGLATVDGQLEVSNNATIYTDTNLTASLVVNFDVSGGVGGTNYAGLGGYPDSPGNTNWNPIVQAGGAGTTTAPSTSSDGVTPCPVTLTINTGAIAENNQYTAYGAQDNFTNNPAGTLANTPVALVGSYLYIDNTFTPSFVVNTIANTLDNVPPGTYNLYLYGNNGGNAGGPGGNGVQNDQGTVFTVSSDLTPATSLITTNKAASLTSNTLINGADYVAFSNVVVGAGETITFTWTANTNAIAADYAGQNSQGVFNGLQLVSAVGPTAGPRPVAINSLLTGSGIITYAAGDTNFMSDLDVANGGNTFSGQWDVVQGALLGGAAFSLGTNTLTIGAAGALETAYNINNTNAGLVLNGKMFLHSSDTFKTLTVNGAVVNAGTYSFSQLNGAYPANFPATWRMQTNSVVNTGSGQITVLSPAGSSSTILAIHQTGSDLTLSWTNGGTLQTTTNLAGPWTALNGASSPFTVIPTNKPAQFYRVHP